MNMKTKLSLLAALFFVGLGFSQEIVQDSIATKEKALKEQKELLKEGKGT